MLVRYLSILLLLTMACATFKPEAFAHEGMSYKRESVDGEVVHLLEVDPSKHSVRLIQAEPMATATGLAKKTHAQAAVNGGFFQADGKPSGLLVVNKKISGYQTKPRAALGWTKDGQKAVLDRVTVRRGEDFKSLTGATTAEQWKEVDFAIGGTPLLIQNGKLIEDFGPEKTREAFLTLKHARTAVCIKDASKWTFVVVEGSSALEGLKIFKRAGFTMKELARFMFDRLQCQGAINLDGGGSSSMVLDGKLVNRTTFGERPLSDVLGVFPH